MLDAMFRNRWRAQEYLLLFAASLAVLALVYVSGGDPPWWANFLTGVGLAAFIDFTEALGRRRERERT